jgi:ABC-type sugar transport system substrate-binding protein
MSSENDRPRARSEAHQGTTRSAFLKRTVAAGALLAAPVATLATFKGEADQTAVAQGGSGGSFPGGSGWDEQVRKVAAGKTLKIGFTPPVLSEFFDEMEHACWQQMANYSSRFGIKWGWARTAPAGNFDAVQEHFNIVQNWVTAGFDAILICTGGDFASMQKVYQGAEAKGTKIYQVNMPMELWPIEKVASTSNIGYDNRMQSGYVAGSYIAKALGGKGTVLQIWGPSGSPWSQARQEGFDLALKENPGLRVVGKADGGYVRDKGFAAAQNLLESHPDVNAVYGENEEMALGASQAIDAKGLKHWNGKDGILTIGADGLRSGFEAIRKGRLTATVDVGGVDQGLESIRTIFAHQILGMAVDRVINVPTVVVDKSNVDQRDAYIAWALGARKP